MKIIQLLHTAIVIAKVVGTADVDGANDRGRRGLRRLQNGGDDPAPPRAVPESNAITCAADETPCHIETGTTESCARAGEACPCYFNERQCSDVRFGEYCDTICCEWGVQE